MERIRALTSTVSIRKTTSTPVQDSLRQPHMALVDVTPVTLLLQSLKGHSSRSDLHTRQIDSLPDISIPA